MLSRGLTSLDVTRFPALGPTPEKSALIRTVPHFRDSVEAVLGPDLLFQTYAVGFADLLKVYKPRRAPRVIVDVGAGYGWLSCALASRSGARIIAIDKDSDRMQAARRIAAIFGVEGRVEWRIASLPNLPLADQEADVTFCVEVIEHIDTRSSVVRELGRVTRDLLVVTTPNRNFPVLAHDTRLPFCHWLPLPARDFYASLFGRRHLQENSAFWSNSMVAAALSEFSRESRFLQFPSFADYLRSEQAISVLSGTAAKRRWLRRLLFGLAASFGARSIHLLPNLASVYRRRGPEAPR